MTTAHIITLVCGSILLITAMVTVMAGINDKERRHMRRRRQEWISNGRIPEDEPKFDIGMFGGSVG